MKRTMWALLAGAVVTVSVTGCGNLKKDEFLPEYEAYKAENEDRFSGLASADSEAASKIGALEPADMRLQTAIDGAKNDAIAASEQGDADTLESANESAMEGDNKLRGELTQAIAAAKTDAMNGAKKGDDSVRSDLKKSLDQAAAAAMAQLDQLQSKSAGDLDAFRAETADALRRAVPIKISTVNFGSGSTRLSDAAKGMLDKAVAKIKENPSAVVVVTGHADSRPILSGSFMTNLQLSEARAKSAADYLKSKGVMNTIRVRGRGHFETSAAQSTSAGLAESRRVEITLAAE